MGEFIVFLIFVCVAIDAYRYTKKPDNEKEQHRFWD